MNMTGGNIVLNLCSFILEASASGICSPYSLSALGPCPCVVGDPYGRGAAVARSQSRVYEVYARSSNDRRMIS